MVLCRAKLRLSMNQIAKVFGRSTATVYKYVTKQIDNRRLTHRARLYNNSRFKHCFTDIKIKMKMFLQGLISFQEAMTMDRVSIAALDWYIRSKNWSTEEEEDPA